AARWRVSRFYVILVASATSVKPTGQLTPVILLVLAAARLLLRGHLICSMAPIKQDQMRGAWTWRRSTWSRHVPPSRRSPILFNFGHTNCSCRRCPRAQSDDEVGFERVRQPLQDRNRGHRAASL